MTKCVLLAGILGGLAIFAWTSIAHMVLPLGEVGVQELPNEAPVLAAMNSQIGNRSGLYFFPGMGLGPNATHAQRNAAMKDYEPKLAANPSGILIYHPAGAKMRMGAQLGTEFLTELAEAFLLVLLLARARITTFGGRVRFAVIAGVMVAIGTNVSYWNWYGFPGNYTFAYMLIQVVGFLCMGIVAGLVMKGGAEQTAAAAA
jgi:hypothetical protein